MLLTDNVCTSANSTTYTHQVYSEVRYKQHVGQHERFLLMRVDDHTPHSVTHRLSISRDDVARRNDVYNVEQLRLVGNVVIGGFTVQNLCHLIEC
jgi:hypothetical protein